MPALTHSMGPAFTVVVCTRDRPLQLEACLAALVQQRHPHFDILVVDNGSADHVHDICARRGIACISEPVAGLTRARNLGARAARGEFVAYIDDDAVAEPDWLGALAREFADPEVAAVAGRTRYMRAHGGTLHMSDEDAPEEIGPRPRRSFDRTSRDWFTLACLGQIGDGNTMAFRRSVLTSSVRFDERLGRGRLIDSGDEHVAFMSLISDGYRVIYAPEAVVRHPIPAEPRLRSAKRFRDLRSSVAYIFFLWLQFPGHRVSLARFLRRALLRRLPGSGAATPAAAGLSPFEVVAALCGGVHTYWKARQQWLSHRQVAGNPVDAATPRVVTLR